MQLELLILMWFTIFSDILRHVLDLDYSILQEYSLESHALQMQIMQDLRMIGGLPLVFVLSMVITSYHGKARNKRLYLVR